MNEQSSSNSGGSGGGCGLGIIGMAIAGLCSWTINHSILWACFHALFWPFYLVYLCMGCGGGFPSSLPW